MLYVLFKHVSAINISQIILYFVSPDGVFAALPQGGQMLDEYFANEKYYIEGVIKQR
jgi:hypothetical protein